MEEEYTKQDITSKSERETSVSKPQNLFQEQLREIREKISGLEVKTDKEFKKFQVDYIQTLGIFVALFTFVSIEFQIFRSFNSWMAGASLSLILLGSLLFFLVIMSFILNSHPFKIIIILLIIASLLIIGGIYFFSKSNLNNPEYISLEAKDLNEKIIKGDQNIKDNFYSKKELENIIKENKVNKNILNCLEISRTFNNYCFSEEIKNN